MTKAMVKRLFPCRRHTLLMLPVIFVCNPALAWSQSTKALADENDLFSCHVDKKYKISNVTALDPDDPLEATSPQSVDEELRLVVNVKSLRMSFIMQVEGGVAWKRPLQHVEQGSSPGSGTGGKEDTTIRGVSGENVYTLFASYDSNGLDHDAALQVNGGKRVLFACDTDMYSAPTVKGLGRLGWTNIYGLAAAGLAAKMSDLPEEPAVQNRR